MDALMARAHTYTLAEPYEATLGLVRSAVDAAHVAVALECDLAQLLRDQYSVRLASCRVFLLYSPAKLLQSMVLDPRTAPFTLLPLAVSERDHTGLVHVPSLAENHPGYKRLLDCLGGRIVVGQPSGELEGAGNGTLERIMDGIEQ